MSLKNFIDLNEDEKKMILSWRNHFSIRKWMYNQNEISEKNHFDFIENLKQDKKNQYFVVQKEDYVGVIYFTEINYQTSIAQIGLYSKPNLKGMGNLLMEEILEYSVKKLSLNRLIVEVFENNLSAIKLYDRFGFKKIERQNNVIVMEQINENR